MNRILSILFALGLAPVLAAATLADPPKDTGIAFKITKVERIIADNAGFDVLTTQVVNESKSTYWIMSGEKDPVELHSRGNPESLVYMLHHTYTTEYDDHHHTRKRGHWQRTHPLDFKVENTRWIELGPGQEKEIRVPVADTLVDHAAQVALSMFFSREAAGQRRFYLTTKPVIVKAQSGRREVLTPAPHTTGHTDP
jgi:hypothetical protein